LGGEEYEPDAAYFENKPFDGMNLYLGTVGKLAKDGGAKPYQYGHIVEVAVRPDGGTTVTKHFAMGRLSFELADVMADGKTAYIGDDGDDVIRAMFVADQPGDLSAGTLYAAKWNQRSGEGFGSAGLEWIRLGHATDAEIKSLADKGIRFSDIFDIATAEEVKANPEKFANFKPVYAYSGTGGKTTLTYYNLRPGMETAAAFLETRRFAAYKGATTEFTKMEGQAHNSADKKLYTVISYIRKGMIDGQNKDRPRDDISLKGDEVDLTCGAVYQSNLRGNQKDTDGETISSELVATDMTAVIHGERQVENPTAGKYDKCNTEMIANPDNIRYSEAMRTLFIGGDSANHLNNFVWAYGVDDGSLTRLFSAPVGAENTGLTVVDNAYGHAYITTNLQHPGTAEDLSQYPDEIKVALRHLVDERGALGYFSGLPGLSR
jgi:secreted PhoX family phosphatase